MKKNTIEYLAYLLDEAKKNEGREKAIVFLGAGVSVSAGIPLTATIVEDIKDKFSNNPIIKECIKTNNDNYYSLMGALTADERRDLFHFYVTRDEVKLNLANIYLAQLLKLGYIDYIVTVNFDDLILKACTLFNFLPPVYDISNIKTITTTDIRKKSVIYLHGQYFGQWLLNNPDELAKVEDEVLRLFNSIKTRRTWIVVGYSGNDGIFNKIKSLGSFSNELFWVKNKFSEADKDVLEFIETPNINANKIEGYYADSFFLKLHAELSKLDKGLNAPEIISKPFTFVKSVLQSINEIKEDDELNDNVKKMVINCNKRINKAISQYEEEGTEENLKQKIVDAILKGDFNEEVALSFENEIKKNNYKNVTEQLSWYYNDWGNALSDLAKQENDEILFRKSFEKYKIASELAPKETDVLYNWGNALLDLARQNNDSSLFMESFEKYKRASQLSPQDVDVFNNWGSALSDLAKYQKDEALFRESFEKYKIASNLDPQNPNVFYNWGTVLLGLALQNNDESLFKESFEKYKRVSELNPKNINTFINWGTGLLNLAKLNNDELLFRESFDIYKRGSKLAPKNATIFNNWGISLSYLAVQKSDEEIFRKSFEKYRIASELDSNCEDVFLNWGTALARLAKQKGDEILFRESFDKYKIASEQDPKKASIFYNWGIALSDLAVQKSDETLFRESFEKYKMASELNQQYTNVFNNWATALADLAKQKGDKFLFDESLTKYDQALKLDPKNLSVLNNFANTLIQLGKLLNNSKYFKTALSISQRGYLLDGNPYNLSCSHALLSDKENALKYLKETLDKEFLTIEHINKDDDWEAYRKDEDFINLINQYK